MNLVWSVEGVNISNITSNEFIGQSLLTKGTGWMHKDIQFQWTATVTSDGWYIVIIGVTGKIGSYQGATFNLPLEIATAAKRLL